MEFEPEPPMTTARTWTQAYEQALADPAYNNTKPMIFRWVRDDGKLRRSHSHCLRGPGSIEYKRMIAKHAKQAGGKAPWIVPKPGGHTKRRASSAEWGQKKKSIRTGARKSAKPK